MNKKIIYFAILSLPIFILAKMPEQLSFGAPVSSSGAPGEVTCAASGCHDDAPLNVGNAVLSISVANNITKYTPGQTYPITVRISETGVNRFGFQLVALKNNDNLNAGTVSITDPARTQMITNDIALLDRKYATYTYQGTAPSSPGVGEWTINWTAPDQNAGPVTFYVGSVSANNDHTDFGDHVYTTSLTLTPNIIASTNNGIPNMSAEVYVNNALKELNINLQLKNEAHVKCTLYNIQGGIVKVLFDEKMVAAEKKIVMNVPDGIYFVKLTSNQKEQTSKIIIQ